WRSWRGSDSIAKNDGGRHLRAVGYRWNKNPRHAPIDGLRIRKAAQGKERRLAPGKRSGQPNIASGRKPPASPRSMKRPIILLHLMRPSPDLKETITDAGGERSA